MTNQLRKTVAGLICITAASMPQLFAQAVKQEKPNFKIQHKVDVTGIKNQARTGTCWSFATSSFLESEAIRMGKGQHDISEMYFVRHNYPRKADHYVRMQGKANFGQGSLSHDVITAAALHGIVPEEIYNGLNYGKDFHDHGQLFSLLKGMLDGVLESKGKALDPKWKEAYEAVLDTYLGKIPESFEYQGKTYSPQSYAKEVIGFDAGNYIELTSFANYPLYQPCVLEVPDNWANGIFYNVTVDELEEVMDNALKNGFSIAWDGDVSEKAFSHGKGMAIVPEKEVKGEDGKIDLVASIPEKVIDQEMRQETFDNFTTTDDHLMHVVGSMVDDNGVKFYLTKNSWGDSNELGGYLYMSKSYVRLKTVGILVHKDAIPKRIKDKLNIK
ncbi:aminopeptidase C [Rapidithrix thailandica]